MTTLSERHRARLATLLESLDPEGGVHNFFIKCVKPNDRMQPHTHHGGYVARQLRHQGVLQAVALIKEGYPFRVAYAEVHTRYAPLLAQLAATGRPGTKRFAAIGPRGLVTALLRAEELRPTIDYLLGSSRVFLRLGKAQLLERMLSLPPSAVLPELEARLAAQAARVRARIVLRVAMRRCAVGRVRKKERQREAAVSIQSRARVLPARRVVAGKRAEREAAERRAAEEREAEAARLAEEAERLARQQAEATRRRSRRRSRRSRRRSGSGRRLPGHPCYLTSRSSSLRTIGSGVPCSGRARQRQDAHSPARRPTSRSIRRFTGSSLPIGTGQPRAPAKGRRLGERAGRPSAM